MHGQCTTERQPRILLTAISNANFECHVDCNPRVCEAQDWARAAISSAMEAPGRARAATSSALAAPGQAARFFAWRRRELPFRALWRRRGKPGSIFERSGSTGAVPTSPFVRSSSTCQGRAGVSSAKRLWFCQYSHSRCPKYPEPPEASHGFLKILSPGP